jgi:putative DNA primase/helicase
MTRFFKETWASRRDAELWSIKEKTDGVGVMFSAVGNDLLLGGVDLDTCRNVQTGELESWASEVVARFQSYTEVSPSQTGANLFSTYDIGEQEKIKAILGGTFGGSFKKGGNGPEHPPGIEIYISRRFFTVTDDEIGDHMALWQVSIDDLRWIVEVAGPKLAGKNTNGSRDNSRSAKAFRRMCELKASEFNYGQCRDALLASPDPDIRAWANEKGLANGEREMRWAYENAKSNSGNSEPGTISLADFLRLHACALLYLRAPLAICGRRLA